MPQATSCEHLSRHPDLEVLFVSDTYLSIAQAFIRCATCEQHYFIELVDLTAGSSAFRISVLAEDVVAATVHSLQKGSCDINRAGAELSFISQSADHLPGVLLRQESTRGPHGHVAWRYIEKANGVEVPREDWRLLPCDGSLIKALDHSM